MTLDRVVVDLKDAFAPGQAYVALRWGPWWAGTGRRLGQSSGRQAGKCGRLREDVGRNVCQIRGGYQQLNHTDLDVVLPEGGQAKW
jgi:hypothetical protein